ncbi:MAG TPA: hypothetical protein VKF41_10025 [Bryobacteraceae bacterium]|nr:hypothetical protein [Bryobacteraceae bacterium]
MPDQKSMLDFWSGISLASGYGALGGFVYGIAALIDGGKNEQGQYEVLKRVPWQLFLFGRVLVGLGGGIAALMITLGMGRFDVAKTQQELSITRLGLAAVSFVAGFIAYRLLPAVAARFENELLKTQEKLHDTEKRTDSLQERVDATTTQIEAYNALNSDLGTAMEFLNLAQQPAGHRDQLIERLEKHREMFPLHRKLNIVLGRLYRESKEDFDSAIEVLETFVKRKITAGEGKDRDTADALFNVACYCSLKMGITTGDKRKNLEDKAVAALTQSVALLPANAMDVQTDKDLENLRQSGRIQQLLAQPSADPGHDGKPSHTEDTVGPSGMSNKGDAQKPEKSG